MNAREGSTWDIGLQKSLYGKSLQSYLGTFEPSQFVIATLKAYIKDSNSLMSEVAKRAGMTCSGSLGDKPPHANKYVQTKPELVDDMETVSSDVKNGISIILSEDLELLSASVANGIDRGMTLSQYNGKAQKDDVRKFF